MIYPLNSQILFIRTRALNTKRPSLMIKHHKSLQAVTCTNNHDSDWEATSSNKAIKVISNLPPVRRRGRLASSAESDKTGSWNQHTIHHHSQLQSQSQSQSQSHSLSTSSSSSYSVEDASTARINSPSSPNMEEFDSLRREATKLERVLEDKVSRYQQVRVSP